MKPRPGTNTGGGGGAGSAKGRKGSRGARRAAASAKALRLRSRSSRSAPPLIQPTSSGRSSRASGDSRKVASSCGCRTERGTTQSGKGSRLTCVRGYPPLAVMLFGIDVGEFGAAYRMVGRHKGAQLTGLGGQQEGGELLRGCGRGVLSVCCLRRNSSAGSLLGPSKGFAAHDTRSADTQER